MKIYKEMVRNTEMGIKSIEGLLGFVESDKLKNLMLSQKEVMEDFYQRAKCGLSEEEMHEAQSGKIQKGILKAGVYMNAMLKRDNSHIASMLIDGYNMGITSVQKCINELQSDAGEIPDISKDLMKTYDKNIKALRAYL